MRCDAQQLLQWKLEVMYVGCQRQLPGTVTGADRDSRCAADGERVAADIEAEEYHRR